VRDLLHVILDVLSNTALDKNQKIKWELLVKECNTLNEKYLNSMYNVDG
jgi:hypothetical protein